MIYVIIILIFMFAWARIEFSDDTPTNGVGSLTVGCLLFGLGASLLNGSDKIGPAAFLAAGLFISLVGAARFAVYEIKNR